MAPPVNRIEIVIAQIEERLGITLDSVLLGLHRAGSSAPQHEHEPPTCAGPCGVVASPIRSRWYGYSNLLLAWPCFVAAVRSPFRSYG